jgi:lysozyme family protein
LVVRRSDPQAGGGGRKPFYLFESHLHNGDPLTARTHTFPPGRPIHGEPPFTWEASAEDSLRYENLTKVTDWSLPNALKRLEKYNGTGSLWRGINTPYLWSYSNHYTKGKFVKDRDFRPEAVSKQSGAAVVLKRMMEKGGHPLMAARPGASSPL